MHVQYINIMVHLVHTQVFPEHSYWASKTSPTYPSSESVKKNCMYVCLSKLNKIVPYAPDDPLQRICGPCATLKSACAFRSKLGLDSLAANVVHFSSMIVYQLRNIVALVWMVQFLSAFYSL